MLLYTVDDLNATNKMAGRTHHYNIIVAAVVNVVNNNCAINV